MVSATQLGLGEWYDVIAPVAVYTWFHVLGKNNTGSWKMMHMSMWLCNLCKCWLGMAFTLCSVCSARAADDRFKLRGELFQVSWRAVEQIVLKCRSRGGESNHTLAAGVTSTLEQNIQVILWLHLGQMGRRR